MKIITCLAMLLFTLSMGAQTKMKNGSWNGGNRVTGNGDMTTQQRDLPSFSGVDACCNFIVEIIKDATQSVRVEAESNLLQYVKTEVVDGRLMVGFVDGASIRTRKNISIYIRVPTLDYLAAGSACEVEVKPGFTSESMEIHVNSAAHINADFNANEVRVNAGSAGRLDLKGSGTQLQAVADSASKIDAGNYTTKTAEVNASSGASVEINVSEKLRSEASSGGNVKYRGGATDVVSNATSGGTVRGN